MSLCALGPLETDESGMARVLYNVLNILGLAVACLVPLSSAESPVQHPPLLKRRGHDVHSRIPAAANSPSRHQHVHDDPHVIHGQERVEYEALRKQIDEHVEGPGARAWAGRIPDHLVHHFTREGEL